MKKSTLCLTKLLLVTMVLSTMVSCTTQEQEYYEKNPTATPATTERVIYTVDPYWTPMPAPTNSKGETITGNPYDYINPERLYNVGEWIEIKDFYFRVNDVEITKKTDGIDTSRLFDPDLERVQDGFSFFIIDIDIRNSREEEFEYCVGSIKSRHQQGDSGGTMGDTRYIEPEMYHDKHAWFYLFQPGEKMNFKIVSVVEDMYLTEDRPFYVLIKASSLLNDIEEMAYDFDSYVVINKDKSEVDVYA